MRLKWVLIGVATIVALAVAGVVWSQGANGPVPGAPEQHFARGGMAQLTLEQREQVKAEVQELRERGAAPAEIRDVVAEMLKGWGIEAPGRRLRQSTALRWLQRELTPERKEQLRDRINELREQGASQEEIHGAVQEMLRAWGVEMPQQRQGPFAQLTPEQREQLQAKVQELKEQGASGEEIHGVVQEMLRDWGVERPQQRQGPFAQLTPEQREQLHAKVQELKGQGAPEEDIHGAVQEMLRDWGVEIPQRAPGPFAQLTPEQREQLHAKVQELKEQGASREEIGTAIREMLQDCGIEAPQQGQRLGAGQHLGGGLGWLQQLTPEQREELWAKVQELKDQGASQEEIHDAVQELFGEWGIECPE